MEFASPLLVVFGGLPGTGKTTVARAVATELRGAFVRIDVIEAAMWRAGIGRTEPTGIGAYVVAGAVAEGCLQACAPVVVDAVNPVEDARRGWRELAQRTGALLRVIEVVCPDLVEHRRRVEERRPDIDGQTVPTWEEVMRREYVPWSEARLVLDASKPVSACLTAAQDFIVRPLAAGSSHAASPHPRKPWANRCSVRGGA